MLDLAILIPAAGASRRMRGADKLLEKVDGEMVLRRTARLAAATGADVIVTLPAGGALLAGRQSALEGLPVRTVLLSDAKEGMAASMRAGVRETGSATALMVLMPDNPDILAEDLALAISTFMEAPGVPLRAVSEDGSGGHPVIFPRRLLADLVSLTGDRGGRSVLTDEKVRNCIVPGGRAITDLDTPEAWKDWRRRTGR